MRPLVSIMIPNYNHSKYLKQCIESALAQTYDNIEIVVLDNSSTDESLKVLMDYRKDGVRVCRNERNIFSGSYRILAEELTSGKYMMLLPADDYILPEFVETGINIMEKYENVGYVHMERDFIKDTDEMIELDPFYNCSFVVNGRKAMPIYMVTTVAHPAQGIFRRSTFESIHGYDAVIDYANVDKTLWFYLSALSDYAYISRKLSCVRIGCNTETNITQNNFQHPILMYLTLCDFVNYAKREGIQGVYERGDEAFGKLATEFLTICGRLLLQGDFPMAKKYFVFCKIISREIEKSESYQKLYNMWETKVLDKEFLQTLCANHFEHKRGYTPPDGYTKINIEMGEHNYD